KSLKIRALPTIWWFMWALGSEGETNSNSTNSVNICKNAKKSVDYVPTDFIHPVDYSIIIVFRTTIQSAVIFPRRRT
ncbi:MAG: hypothetical protein ACK53Y_07805, partial [bacterium]